MEKPSRQKHHPSFLIIKSSRLDLIPLIEALKAASTAPKICTAKSKRDYIGVQSYPIKLIRYECTPIWPFSLSGVHSIEAINKFGLQRDEF